MPGELVIKVSVSTSGQFVFSFPMAPERPPPMPQVRGASEETRVLPAGSSVLVPGHAVRVRP